MYKAVATPVCHDVQQLPVEFLGDKVALCVAEKSTSLPSSSNFHHHLQSYDVDM